jgi:hypothetical protein
MALDQQEPGNKARSGNPAALNIIIMLILLETAWQGWTILRWHIHDTLPHQAIEVFGFMLSLATAWGLWRRKAWSW